MKNTKKLLAGILSLAIVITLCPAIQRNVSAATGYSVTNTKSVTAGETATYKVKGVSTKQYIKVAVTGAAKAGVTVKCSGKTVTSTKTIKGTGKTLALKVTAKESAADKKFNLVVKVYNKSTKKLVKTLKVNKIQVNAATSDEQPQEPVQPSEEVTGVTEGASFRLMSKAETACTDSPWTPEEDYSFYLYKPSYYHTFDMMSGQLNPVIMVYPDAVYASAQDAYDALKAAGIIDIAENNSAFVIIPNPLNGTSYTEEDVNLYYESQVYLAGGKIVSFTPPTGEYERCTFNNMLYCIGEGSGATFINNYLTQNANRIAAVLTFGGEMDSSISDGVALPAYLVNAADKAVSYYKNVNETDTQDGNTYVNSGYTEKKVIVAEGGDTFDASVIQTAWDELLGKTTRAPLACDVVANTYDTSEWVLMSWPNYDAIGLSVTKGSYSYDGTDYDVYDYVPASYDGQTAVPLVVLLHGYTEDPLCPAATCGWADKAAEEGFILITPDYYNDLTASGAACGSVMQAVKEAIERYNIDTTRVYMTGFSMGGMTTAMTGYTNADVFAAIAPMSGMGDFTKEGLVVTQSDAEKYDLPTFFLAGTIDDKNTVMDENGTPVSITAMTGNDIYSKMAEFNEISFDAADYSINLFGHLADHSYSEEHQGYKYDIYQYYSSKYTNPTLEFVAVNGVAHACSNVYADLAWDFMKNFSRAADGTIVELK